MEQYIIMANIIMFSAGICSILSTQGKQKKNIVFVEFLGTILRIIGNVLAKNWTDAIAKIIKGITQFLSIKNKFNKNSLIVLSCIYTVLSLMVVYIFGDIKYLVAIIPSLLEFYALISPSTRKYRWFIITTKTFWIINNFIFKLYVGVLFDVTVIICHLLKLYKSTSVRDKI
ncbi:MAG: YgjV family protein [Clostridia bacterium]|nr:YgjV family protein [Clostridia bacterium]